MQFLLIGKIYLKARRRNVDACYALLIKELRLVRNELYSFYKNGRNIQVDTYSESIEDLEVRVHILTLEIKRLDFVSRIEFTIDLYPKRSYTYITPRRGTRAILTIEQADEIRRWKNNGVKYKVIYEAFPQVSRKTIYRILKHITHK